MATGLLSLAGCRDRQERSNETATDPGAANQDLAANPERQTDRPPADRPPSVQATSVKNSEAAALVRAVNQSEVDEAKSVMGKLRSEPAKNLARLMVDEHSAALRELDRIVSSSSIAPQENDKVRELQKDSRENLRELNEADAKDVDMMYIELQIEEHEDALELLDDKLIEEANDPGLSKFLRDQRGKIASHLERAKQAKEDLKARQ
jgi:putative membrane protein